MRDTGTASDVVDGRHLRSRSNQRRNDPTEDRWTVVQTYDNLGGDADSGQFVELTYVSTETIDPGQIRIEFTNDDFDPVTGADRNVRVDKIAIDGITFETEDPSVFSTGTWKAEDGITPGFRESEELHSDGYFQFAPADDGGGEPPSGSKIQMLVQGDVGTEQFDLQIKGASVGIFTASTDSELLTYTHGDTVTANDIRIEFINDTWDPANNIDSNLTVDYISIDGNVYQTEDPSTFSTGSWKPEDGVTAGYRESETLNTDGYFQYASTPPEARPGVVSIDGPAALIDEGEDTVTVTLTRTDGSLGEVTVDYATQAGTATAGDDFAAKSGTITFADGQTTAEVVISIVDDTASESAETFSVEITNPTGGASLGSIVAQDITIRANDGTVPGAEVQLRVRGDEGTEKLNLLIKGVNAGTYSATSDFQTITYVHTESVIADDVRVEFINDQWDPDQGIDSNLTVDYITIDGNVYQTEDPSTFSTGTWKAADGIVPGFRESETLNTDGYFQYAGGTPVTKPGQFAFSQTTYLVDEGAPSIQVRVDRLGGTDGVVSVDYETFDITTTQLEDYVAVVGTLTFGDGQESMLVTVPVIQDPFVEGDEVFGLRLKNATGGATIDTSETTVTITDDDTQDPAGLFRFEKPMYMIMEGMMPTVTVKVIRDGGSSGDVTVDYATDSDGATAGEDFTGVSGTLSFADGETEKTITVPILDDNLAEDDERFWMYLSNPTNGSAAVVSGAQLIIMDNEPRSGSGDGLYGEYFTEMDLTGLARVGVDERINYSFGNGGPAGVGSDTFSIRWTGQIEAMHSEEYTFYTTSDDGVRLWIDGQLIIDNWTDHAPKVDTGKITLEAGKLYDLRMEFYENEGGATVQLEWSSASQQREIVPQSQLYSAGDFQRNGSTYALTPNKMTWQAAQNYAQRLGGNLVTINDAAEEAWLRTTFGTAEKLWIGLNDVDLEGNFVWASGEAATYRNFAAGEPNNSGGIQDFGVMNFGSNGEWDDDSSTATHFGVIELTGDSLPSQNAVFGDWSEVIDMPNIAVAAAQLPDGEIVTWSSWDRYNFGGNNPRTYTSVFNTETREVEEFLITQTQHDMFCPGTVMLADGRIMVNGGGSTVTSTSVYDFETDTWTRVENMKMRRWYNTSVTLADGRVLTWGGNAKDNHAGNMEVWEDGKGWSFIDNSDIDIYKGTGDQSSWHPQMFQAPNGKVFIAGPGSKMYWADLDSRNVLEFAGNRGTDGYSQHGSYVMYDVGKILKFGGADKEANNGKVTNKAYIIDINGDTPVVTETGSMNFNRKFLNGVVLPDGRVMAVGGNTSGKKFSDDGSVYAGEIWDPATGEWSVMDSMEVPRNYHAVALLQADGTVLAAGGGLTGGGAADHPDAQVFSPDYLYDSDGALADRPNITTIDKATFGDKINVQVTDGQAIARFNLIRMSTVTHSINTDQRLIPLSFNDLGNDSYEVDMPGSGNIAPPGFYMLYALNADGTPSESAVIHLT